MCLNDGGNDSKNSITCLIRLAEELVRIVAVSEMPDHSDTNGRVRYNLSLESGEGGA
jgi:hypothetical protein